MKQMVQWIILLCCAVGCSGLFCDNGGFQFNGTCNCPKFWMSDNSNNGCTKIVCINGGYPNSRLKKTTTSTPERCICPTGYMGIHCEAVVKFATPANIFLKTTPTSTLVYVNLLTKYFGGLVYSQFQNAVNNIIDPAFNGNQTRALITISQNAANSYVTKSTWIAENKTILDQPQPPLSYQCSAVPFYQPIYEHILNYNIRESAITVLTQRPASDSDKYQNLLTLAQSFDIRINVIFSDDKTFVRCMPDDIKELQSLAEKTGGLFVIAPCDPNYYANGTIIDTVLTSHIQYEPITMAVNNGSGNANVDFAINSPQGSEKYFAVAFSIGLTNVSVNQNCSAFLSTPVYSGDKAVVVYPLNNLLNNSANCSISFTNVSRVHIFGSQLGFVKLFKSYVESRELDTSKVQPNEGNDLYLSVHGEFTSTVASNINDATFFPDGINLSIQPSTEATFEYISNISLKCNGSSPAWIQLTLQGTKTDKRYIPVFCQDKQAMSESFEYYPTTNNEKPYNIPIIEDGIKTIDSSSLTNMPGPKSFILAYSNYATMTQTNTFILGSIAGGPFAPYSQSFGEILFDIKDKDTINPGNITVGSQTNNVDFNNAVSSTYAYRPDGGLSIPRDSQFLEALKKISDNTFFSQNSIISVNLGLFPTTTSPQKLSDFYSLVNRNIKVVMFIDSNNLSNMNNITGVTFLTDIVNQIAAITSGHLIVCNQSNEGFQNLLHTIYKQGPGQNLLLARNLVGGTSIEKIGTIYLGSVKSQTVNITITFTTNVIGLDGTEAIAPINELPIFQFQCSTNNNNITSAITQLNETNFYSSTITLQGGCDYFVRLTKPYNETKSSLLRIWSSSFYRPNTLDDVDIGIEYRDLQDNPSVPDDYNGAIPAVAVTNLIDNSSSTLDVTYFDCAWNQVDLYDNSQSLPIQSNSTVLRYVPFFCTSKTNSICQPNTENLYYAQYRGGNNDGYVSTKAFVCIANTIKQTAPNCENKDVKGNYMCGGSKSPYRRGRAGMLIDCSNPLSSDLVYDTTNMPQTLAPFKCNCGGGDGNQGPSCEKSGCQQNTQGGATDSYYRTYSVVLGIRKGYADSDLNSFMMDAAELLKATEKPNIWQYQLFVACNTGEVIPLYIGSVYKDFSASFNFFRNSKSSCNSTVATNQFDLTTIYNKVTASVGRQQRGLLVFYYEFDSSSGELSVPDLEKFIKSTQQYRQQVYVTNLYDSGISQKPDNVSDDLMAALMSTGGSLIPLDLESFASVSDMHLTFFNDILGSQPSLSGHEISTKSIDAYVESLSYLIIFSNSYFNDPNLQIVCDYSNLIFGNGGICILNSTKTLNQIFPSNISYSIVSFQTNLTSPIGAFISNRIDDQQTAFAVNYTTGGPTMAIYSGGYGITDNLNGDARVATRESSCTYQKTTVDVVGQLKSGYNSIKMKTNGTEIKVFPFGVSSQINCLNLGSPNSELGYCMCYANWEGPDCSRPVCKNGGSLSTWSNACNCPNGWGGQFCEKGL